MPKKLKLAEALGSLPKVSNDDNGKVLTAENGGWMAKTPASGLPRVTASDAGKILAVGADGSWTAISVEAWEGDSY